MSFAIIPTWVLGLRFSEAEWQVYIALRTYTGKDGRCHPTQIALAERASMSVRTLIRTLNLLRERGVLTTSREGACNAYEVSNVQPAVTQNVTPVVTCKDSKERTDQEQTISSFAAAARALATTYYDRVPLSNFVANMKICRKALDAKYEYVDIEKALLRLADNHRVLTANTLRIELEGPARNGQAVRHAATDRTSTEWHDTAGFATSF